MEEAQLLAQLSLAQGLSYDPEQSRTGASPLCGDSRKDGFEFSSAEINLRIDRNNRLREARAAMLAAPKPPSRHKSFAAASSSLAA